VPILILGIIFSPFACYIYTPLAQSGKWYKKYKWKYK